MILVMNKIIFIILLLSAIGVFFSCGNKLPLENNLKYELVKYENQSEGCDSLRDDNCAKIKIEFLFMTFNPFCCFSLLGRMRELKSYNAFTVFFTGALNFNNLELKL